MAKLLGKHARLYLDTEQVSTRSPELSVGVEATTLDVTTFGADYDQFEVLKASADIQVQAFLDDTYRPLPEIVDSLSDKFWHSQVIDPVTGLVVTTPAVVSSIFRKTPAEGNRGVFTKAYGTFSMSEQPKTLGAVRYQGKATGPVDYGYLLRLGTISISNAGATNNGSVVNIGDAANFLRAAFHPLSLAITGQPLVRIKIQSDDLVGFGTPAERKDFLALLLNLMENPSAGTDAVSAQGYTASGGGSTPTIARITSDGVFGTHCYEVTAANTGAANLDGVRFHKRDGTRTPVTAGRVYTWSMYLKSGTGLGVPVSAGHMGVRWWDAATAGTQVGHTFGQGVGDGTAYNIILGPTGSGWQRYDFTSIAPGGATHAAPVFEESAPANWDVGDTLLFDGLMFHESDLSARLTGHNWFKDYGRYVDGDQYGCIWNGTAHQSVSYRPIAQWHEVLGPLGGASEDFYRIQILGEGVGTWTVALGVAMFARAK